MDLYEFAKYINTSEPLNKNRVSEDIENKIRDLSVEQRINLLVFSFQNYDKAYNKDLCFTYPSLWNEFKGSDWKNLVIDMFPRKFKFMKGDLIEVNTGSYFDIFLLNGIIGVSPFEFIFNESEIDKVEKESFFNYLKYYGESSFFYNEREMIEDIVNFYELEVFSNIVKMKERLIEDSFFSPSKNYNELLNQFIK